MIFVIAENFEGVDIHRFETHQEAEEFCASFLDKNREYGADILLAVEGSELIAKTVSVVEAIKLVRETSTPKK